MDQENWMSTWVSKYQKEFRLHGKGSLVKKSSCISWIRDQDESMLVSQIKMLSWHRALQKAHILSFSSFQVIFISFALIQQGFKGAQIQGCPIVERHFWRNLHAWTSGSLDLCLPAGIENVQNICMAQRYDMTWSEQNVKPDCYVYLVLGTRRANNQTWLHTKI